MKKLSILVLLVFLLSLSSCKMGKSESNSTDAETKITEIESDESATEEIIVNYDINKYFVRKDRGEMSTYTLCYRASSNHTVEIAELGSTSEFHFINNRIYYSGGGLFSIAMDGSDKKYLNINKSNFATIESIASISNDRIICLAQALVKDKGAIDGTIYADVTLSATFDLQSYEIDYEGRQPA